MRSFALTLALLLLPSMTLSQVPTPTPAPAFESTDYHFSSAGTDLVGRLFVPRGVSKFPLVVLVQGSDYDDANASVYWRLVAHTFAKSGIGSFSFNKRDIAGSAGRQTNDFGIQAADVASACKFAAQLAGVDAANVGYYGISQGGWIVPRAVTACRPAFVILVSPGGVSPAQTNDYYLQGQFHDVGMSLAEAKKATQLHDALAAYYRSAHGFKQAQELVNRAVREAWFVKFQKIEFRQDVPKTHRLPTPAQLRTAWQRDPDRFGFYRDDNTWHVPVTLYESLCAPLLLVYGGQDANVPVESSIAVFQRALRANANPDVTIHIFEPADHSIQVGPRLLPGYREYLADWVKGHLRSAGQVTDLGSCLHVH